jgi:hypothetical protein
LTLQQTPANDNLRNDTILSVLTSKTGRMHIYLKPDNLTQQDINRMYRCLSQTINKLRDIETTIYGSKQ